MILATESSIRNELRRKASKPAVAKTTAPVYLANGIATVEFRPAGGTVLVIRRGMNDYGRYPMTVEAARREYRKLIADGFARW